MVVRNDFAPIHSITTFNLKERSTVSGHSLLGYTLALYISGVCPSASVARLAGVLQATHDLFMAPLSSTLHGRGSPHVGLLFVSASFQQHTHHLLMAIHCGIVHGCSSMIVATVLVSPSLQQQTRQFWMTIIRSTVQRSVSKSVRLIWCSTCRQQTPHDLFMTRPWLLLTPCKKFLTFLGFSGTRNLISTKKLKSKDPTQ